jgi:transcriptional regulator with XRE-family HTH domain
MKERLIRLLDSEQLSASKFADKIGVQRSSVSHVLSGRNKPSYDFLQKTLISFPGLSSDWLILGQGEMMTGMPDYSGATLFDSSPVAHVNIQERDEQPASLPLSPQSSDDRRSEAQTETDSTNLSVKAKKLVKVMLFYDDNTFSSFNPSE